MTPLHHLAVPVAVMALSLLPTVASVATAQTRPYGDEQSTAADLAALTAAAAPSDLPGYPAVEVRAVPPARAAAAVARMEYHRAYGNLNGSVRDTQRRLDRSDEMTRALEAERAAWDAYVRAREDALRDVVNDPAYRTNAELRQQIARELEERHSLKDAPRGEIVGLAALKLDYASQARVREQAVLDRSDAVRDARGRLVEARRAITALRDRHADEIRSDPDLVAARTALYDSKVAKIAAEAYLRGVLEARDIALTYTYNRLYRYNPYRVSPYAYGSSFVNFPYSYGY